MKRFFPLLLALLMLIWVPHSLPIATGLAQVQEPGPHEIAILTGPSKSGGSVVPLREMIENMGYPYAILDPGNLSLVLPSPYYSIIVAGESGPTFDQAEIGFLGKAVASGIGLVWIGGAVPPQILGLLGLRSVDVATPVGASRIAYGNLTTGVYSEALALVNSSGATPLAEFLNASGGSIAPAETYFKDGSGAPVFYFAYDATSWWDQDPLMPWLRAYELQIAVESSMADQTTVRLAPFPNGMQSAFVTRIEDVDPLHTGQAWISGAWSFLDYFSSRGEPLSVAMIPDYVNPATGVNITLGAQTTSNLRGWLHGVLYSGGTIVQHGFTHQYGALHTGAPGEFYDPQTGVWMPYHEQLQRITEGRSILDSSLGIRVNGFIAPNYLANADTYRALANSGFEYVSQDNNTPYFDRYSTNQPLVDIPETLGYIPLNATLAIEPIMTQNMRMLYTMGAVMQFYDHLYNQIEIQAGENLLNSVQTLPSVWYTNMGSLATFWQGRTTAYSGFSLLSSSQGVLTMTLGSSSVAGLTLDVGGAPGVVTGVTINGVPWAGFGKSWVILPQLTNGENLISISFSPHSSPHPGAETTLIGYLGLAVSTVVSGVFVVRSASSRTRKGRQPDALQRNSGSR